MNECKHNVEHDAHVAVACLEDSGRFQVEISIKCKHCGRPFQFLGLPLGIDLNGAAMSVDGLQARLAIAPLGTVPQPLDAALVAGYRVKTGKEH